MSMSLATTRRSFKSLKSLHSLNKRKAGKSRLDAAVSPILEGLENRTLFANLFWDANGIVPGVGGTGTWDNSSALWTTDGTGVSGHVAWNDAGSHTAIFTGTAGTVTINPADASVSAAALNFQ